MGIPVIDAEDPAGYNCTYTQQSSSNNIATCKCICSCCSSSSSSSRDSNSDRSECSSSGDCSTSNTNSSINRCNCKSTPPTLTLTFANNNNSVSSKQAHNYHHCKTEMLQIPLQNATAPTTLTHSSKDLVGNSKEYRIENNKCDLRIIGNSNRIRISCNQGNLQIIGNSTRLKITNNTGKIRYTGNEGRICLGSDSTQQAVDYIGNNGKLKIVKSADLLSEKCKNHKLKIPKDESGTKTATGTNNESTAAATTTSTENTTFPSSSCSTPKKVKVKSASFAGDYSSKWHQFNELFERHDWRNFGSGVSMPNLKNDAKPAMNDDDGVGEKAEKCAKNENVSKKSSNCYKFDNSINITNNYGNICIKNAVNISI